MSDGQTTVQQMVEKRRHILLAYLVTWDVWWGSRIVEDLFSKSSAHPHWWSALILVQLASWLGWTASLICLMLFMKKMARKPALAAALSDELWRQTRLKAAAFALGALGVTQMAVILLTSTIYAGVTLSIRTGVDINIFVGVTAFIGAFLVLERE